MLADERKAVPFEPAGPGFLIYFATRDLEKLAEKYERRDGVWFEEIERRLQVNDAAVIVDTLRIGLRGPDGERPRGIDYRDLPFAPTEASGPIADALSCALSGTPYARLRAVREEAMSAFVAHVAASAA